MSNISRLLSPRESIQMAWGLKLRDFRQWCSPSSQTAITNWKRRRIEQAIIVSRTNMMDDVEALLKSVQQTDNAANAGKSHAGASVSLPVMITAISALENPPERDVVIGFPNWQDVVVPSDPLQRAVQMRTTPASYRCQVAFFAPSEHACAAIANQFVNFWKHEGKRAVKVAYEVGYAGTSVIRDIWDFRVIENTLYPDKADTGIKNVFAVTIDCVIAGTEPIIVGLGAYGDDITDTGEPDGSIPPGLPPIEGNITPPDVLGKYVIEADAIEEEAGRHTRVTIDPETRIITETDMTR